MLKKMSMKKIVLSSITLLLLLVMYIIPDTHYVDLNGRQILEYVNTNTFVHDIYLLDQNNYVAKTEIPLKNKKDPKAMIKELIEALTLSSSKQDLIPNGFHAMIPSETEVLSIVIEDSIVKLNFNNQLFDISKELEEKMIEALIYTVTSVDGIEGLLLYVDGKLITQLPNSKKILPSLLTRDFGINKHYDLTSTKDINQITIYYLNQKDDNYYYVPVTKYVNDSSDKISIIIKELASTPIYETNLMSFLNSNTKLINYEIVDEQMKLVFNDYILSDVGTKHILEEVLYSIGMSIEENYNIKEVLFYVNDSEISKYDLKSLE